MVVVVAVAAGISYMLLNTTAIVVDVWRLFLEFK